MRLTLRKLLAFLDDQPLSVEQRRKIQAFLEEDLPAEELLQRLQSLAIQPRMACPGVATAGTLDANTVAQYVDNALDAELCPKFERACLKSDAALAELSAVHQIICRMSEQPANIPPRLRDRIYQIPNDLQRDSRLPQEETQTEENPTPTTSEDHTVDQSGSETSRAAGRQSLAAAASLMSHLSQAIKHPGSREEATVTLASPSITNEDEPTKSSRRWWILAAIVVLWISVWFSFPGLHPGRWYQKVAALVRPPADTGSETSSSAADVPTATPPAARGPLHADDHNVSAFVQPPSRPEAVVEPVAERRSALPDTLPGTVDRNLLPSPNVRSIDSIPSASQMAPSTPQETPYQERPVRLPETLGVSSEPMRQSPSGIPNLLDQDQEPVTSPATSVTSQTVAPPSSTVEPKGNPTDLPIAAAIPREEPAATTSFPQLPNDLLPPGQRPSSVATIPSPDPNIARAAATTDPLVTGNHVEPVNSVNPSSQNAQMIDAASPAARFADANGDASLAFNQSHQETVVDAAATSTIGKNNEASFPKSQMPSFPDTLGPPAVSGDSVTNLENNIAVTPDGIPPTEFALPTNSEANPLSPSSNQPATDSPSPSLAVRDLPPVEPEIDSPTNNLPTQSNPLLPSPLKPSGPKPTDTPVAETTTAQPSSPLSPLLPSATHAAAASKVAEKQEVPDFALNPQEMSGPLKPSTAKASDPLATNQTDAIPSANQPSNADNTDQVIQVVQQTATVAMQDGWQLVLPGGIGKYRARGRTCTWELSFSGVSQLRATSRMQEPEITVQRCFVLLTAHSANETLRITTPKGDMFLTALHPSSEIVLEVRPYLPPGFSADTTPTRYVLGCLGVNGTFVVEHNQTEQAISKNGWLMVDIDGQTRTFNEPLPEHIVQSIDYLKDGQAMAHVNQLSELLDNGSGLGNLQAVASLSTAGANADRNETSKRSLAAIWCYYMGEMSPLVRVLNDPTMQADWQDHIDSVRDCLISDALAMKQLRRSLQPLGGDDLEQRIAGYNPQEIKATIIRELVTDLNSPTLVRRVLAIHTLQQLWQKDFGYNPLAEDATRQLAVQQWEQLLQESLTSRIGVAPAPSLVPTTQR